MPRNPPKSIMAAWIRPSRPTMTSTIRPMSSPALLRTPLPTMAETSSSSTTASVLLWGLRGKLPTEDAAVPDSELSCPRCTAGIDGSAVCESWLAWRILGPIVPTALGDSGIVAAMDNTRREQSSRGDCGNSETVAHDRALPPRPPTHNLQLDACDASALELRFMGHGYERAKWKISLIRDPGIAALLCVIGC